MRARTQFKLLRNCCILTVISSQTDLFFDKNIAYAPKVYLKFVFVPKLLKTLYFLSFRPVSLTFILLVVVTIYSIREFEDRKCYIFQWISNRKRTFKNLATKNELHFTCRLWGRKQYFCLLVIYTHDRSHYSPSNYNRRRKCQLSAHCHERAKG